MAVYGGCACLFQFNGSESPPGRLRRGETLRKAEKARKVLSPAFHKKSIYLFRLRPQQIGGPRRGPGGRSESPLVASAEAKPSARQKKQGRSFPLPPTRNLFICSVSAPIGRGAPKGSRGRSESPLVASAEAKPSAKQKKRGRLFPCPPQEIYLFVPSPPP